MTNTDEIEALRKQVRELRVQNNRYYAEMQDHIPQSMKDKYKAMCIEHKELDEKLRDLENRRAAQEHVNGN